MRTHRTTIRVFCWAALLAGTASQAVCQLPTPQPQANKESQLKSILKDWQSRWNRAEAVEYILEGRRLTPKGWISYVSEGLPLAPELAGQDVPAEDYWFPTRRRVVLDFQKSRFRREYRGELFYSEAGRFSKHVHVNMYDGKTSQSFRPNSENIDPDNPNPSYKTELYLQKDMGFSLERLDESLLTPHARFPRFNGPPGVYTRMEQPLNHQAYRMTGSARVGNIQCVVVQTATNAGAVPTYYEYWVDPARESAILKIVHRLPERILQTHEIEHTAQDGSWYPKRIVLTEFLSNGRIEAREELTVTQMMINPELTDSLFHMQPEEGMVVYDEGTSGSYIADEDGELVDFATAVSEHERFKILWWLLAVVIVLVGGFVLWRRGVGWPTIKT